MGPLGWETDERRGGKEKGSVAGGSRNPPKPSTIRLAAMGHTLTHPSPSGIKTSWPIGHQDEECVTPASVKEGSVDGST